MGFFHNPAYLSYRHSACPAIDTIQNDLSLVIGQKVTFNKPTPSWKTAISEDSNQQSKMQFGGNEITCHLSFKASSTSVLTVGFGSPGAHQEREAQLLTTLFEKHSNRFRPGEIASGYGKSANASGFSSWKKLINTHYSIGSLLGIYIRERQFNESLTADIECAASFKSLEQILPKNLLETNISTFIEDGRPLFKLIDDHIREQANRS